MTLPITSEDFEFIIIQTDDEEYESGTYSQIPVEVFMEGIYKHAAAEDMDYECTAYCFDYEADDENDIPATISLCICGDDTFAELMINYSGVCNSGDSIKTEIDLSDIPKKSYGEVIMYDFDKIIEKGVKLFNEQFQEDMYTPY